MNDTALSPSAKLPAMRLLLRTPTHREHHTRDDPRGALVPPVYSAEELAVLRERQREGMAARTARLQAEGAAFRQRQNEYREATARLRAEAQRLRAGARREARRTRLEYFGY